MAGQVAKGYEAVREAFEKNFTEHSEVGAAFALYVRGEKVADLWGGVADESTGRPWEEDTLQLVFSTTKGITAICAHLLAQRGELDLDAPVAEYWPEFKAAGKENVPVRWLLAHRVGLPGLHQRITLEQMLDWDTITTQFQPRPFRAGILGSFRGWLRQPCAVPMLGNPALQGSPRRCAPGPTAHCR